MFFVPHVPQHHRPSPQAEELGRRLGETIDAFAREHPGLSATDIRAAAQLAVQKRARQNPVIAVAIALAAVAAGLVIAIAKDNPGGLSEEFLLPGVILIVVVVCVGLLFYLKSR
jgi:uncharacterized protein (DUF433 family)